MLGISRFLSINVEKQEKTSESGFWKGLIVALSWLVNILNGFLYCYPNYATKLENVFGLSQSDIVIIGVGSHLGIGIVQLPLGYIHRSEYLNKKKGMQAIDRLVTIISVTLLLIGTLGVCLYSHYTPVNDHTTNFIIVFILFICFGAGVGGSFGHTCWVSSYNFAKSPWKKSIIVSMSFTFGFGAFGLSSIFPYTLKNVSLSNIFLIHALCYGIFGILRLFILKRLEKAKKQSLIENRYDNHEEEIVIQRRKSTQPAEFGQLFKSKTVYLLFISTFFGIGIGGTFISMVSDLVESVKGSNNSKLTSRISTVFLASQAATRLISALIVKKVLESALLFFHIVELIFCIYFATLNSPDIISLYIVSIAIGIGFGGIWSMFPAIVADYWPGGRHNFGPNLGMSIFAPAFGNLIVGVIETQVFKAQNGGNSCNNNSKHCYRDVFTVFYAFSALSIILVVFLMYVMKKKPRGY